MGHNMEKNAYLANAGEPVRNDSTARRASIHEDDVLAAVVAEHELGFWHNVSQNRKATAWSVLVSAAVIMEGFDLILISNLLAVDAFQRQFGREMPNGKYELTAAWQAGLTNGALVGEIIGLMLNGIIADRFGFRKTMIGALVGVAGLIFIPFFAKDIVQLLIGLILMGIPWGVFQTLTTTYAAEICPTGLRPYLTTYVNLCWIIGQILASGVLVGVQGRSDDWAYKIPYALQWMWPVPLIIGILFAPESPWWLVRKGRMDDAMHVLRRLTKGTVTDAAREQTLAMIKQTNDFEMSLNEGTSYWDCFKGVNLRRTEIVCVTWVTQAIAGSTFFGYSTYFYEAAGLAQSNAFALTLGQYAIGFMGTVFSWALMGFFGRRTLQLSGLVSLVVIFLIIGFLGIAPAENSGASWAVGSMLIVIVFIYDCTIGPVTYCLVAEMPSTRLRQKSVVLARNAYNVASIISNVLITRQLNPGAWAWGAKAGFFWSCSAFLCLTWAYFRLPEPKGRTYAELDTLFERKVSARKFTQYTAEDLIRTNMDRTSSVQLEKEEVAQHMEKA